MKRPALGEAKKHLELAERLTAHPEEKDPTNRSWRRFVAKRDKSKKEKSS